MTLDCYSLAQPRAIQHGLIVKKSPPHLLDCPANYSDPCPAPDALDNLKAKLKAVFKKKTEKKPAAETKPAESKPAETTPAATSTTPAASEPAKTETAPAPAGK